jgi:hypothetical protein
MRIPSLTRMPGKHRISGEQAMLFGKTIAAGALPNKAQLDAVDDLRRRFVAVRLVMVPCVGRP